MKVKDLFEAGELATKHEPKNTRTPVPRDAAYIKKVSNLKVGTNAWPRGLSIGDWVKITTEDSPFVNEFGYIVSKRVDDSIKIDISNDDKPHVVTVKFLPDNGVTMRWAKKWKENDGFIASVGGKTGDALNAKKEKVAAKASSTEMPTSVPSYVYGDSTAQPNMNFPTAGKPLHVDETRPRTAEEKAAAKDMIKQLEADLKIHKAFWEANKSPNDKVRAQVLKNSERIVEAFKKVNAALDDYIVCIKILNKEANSGDRELFQEARNELGNVINPLYDDLKTIKLKATIPKYVSRARVLAAVAIDTMFAEEKKVDAWSKRRDWSKEKLAAAKKTSDRMKLAWKE